MRGHITKRGKNSYTIVLNLGIDPQTGKRKQQWVSVKGNKKDAKKRLSELLHQLDTGVFMRPTKTTLAEFLEKWLKDYAWPNLAPRTAEGYEHIVRRHFIPALGNMMLTQLKPEHLQKYYSQKIISGRCNRLCIKSATCSISQWSVPKVRWLLLQLLFARFLLVCGNEFEIIGDF